MRFSSARFIVTVLLVFCAQSLSRGQVVLTQCTEENLRVALAGGKTIQFDCDTMLVLSNTIVVSTNVTLDAQGRNVTISGGDQVRIFEVEPNVTLTLRNLRLINGLHGGNSTNTNSVVTITGMPARGGAIYNRGTVVLVETQLAGNVAEGVNGKAGASPNSAAGEDGQSGGRGLGGAVFNDRGFLIASNCVFFANSARGGEGGDGGNGGVFGHGTHGGDGGDGGDGAGGAIFNLGGAVQIFNTTFTSNRVAGAVAGFGGFPSGLLGLDGANGEPGAGRGGAIFNDGGTVSIQQSTFAVNQCLGATGNDGLPGSLSSDGEDGKDGSAALGGAIFHSSGTLRLVNSTLTGSILVGGQAGKGGDGGMDSFGGDGGDGGRGGATAGGGLYVLNGSAELVNVTISGNALIGGQAGTPGKGGGFSGREGDEGSVGRTSGAAIENANGNVSLKNTLLAQSDLVSNVGGAIADGGNNLSSDPSARFTAASSLNNVNPLLGALGDHGGRTHTIALSTNSPAVDRGNSAMCLEVDQRGAKRVGPCDIGAFELNGVFTGLTLTASPDPAAGGVRLSWPITVDYLLESSDSLAEPVRWTIITNVPARSGGSNSVVLSPTTREAYFRLRRR